MTPVILSAGQARERSAAEGETPYCTCPLDHPCQGCGGEADVIRVSHVNTSTAGWVAT